MQSLLTISEPSKIIDHLYLGSIQSMETSILNNLDINVVINVTKIPDTFSSNRIYYIIPINDEDTDIYQYFNSVSNIIDQRIKENKNVLVHCAMGISRSATIVIAYLMNKQAMGYAEAFNLVFSKRSIINPNWSFRHQLMRYERALHNNEKCIIS